MPSTYAHYRLGKLLLKDMPAQAQQSITRFRRMYDMGLQGPDIFFYHNPLVKTAQGRLGSQFHRLTGREFFEAAGKRASSEAARVYLYGVLAHYALDSASHPFVNKKVEAGEAEHVPMEKEFDRYLMELDGVKSPDRHDIGKLIRLTRGECVTVSALYPGSTPNGVYASVKNMAWSLTALATTAKGKLAGLAQALIPHLLKHGIPEEPREGFERFNSELLARFNWAVRDYPKLLVQLEAFLDNETPLEEGFQDTFG